MTPTNIKSKRTTRIIDNKKIKLTDDEFKLYQEICQSYTSDFFQGSELFKDRFAVDENGFIIFLIPPNSAVTSMEVWMFLMNIMAHQHLDAALEEVATIKTVYLQNLSESQKLLEELKKESYKAQ